MNRFIVLLTVAMILSHAIVGCDNHAAHGSVCRAEVHVGSSGHHEHDSSDGVRRHEPIDQHAPDHGEECCRLTCKWMSPDVVADVAFEQSGRSTIVDEHLTANSRSSHALLSLDSRADFLLAQPLRSHLALGVLLI
jgi:hypothetical protein